MFSGGEKKLSFVFNFGFLIGKHTSATLARKLFVVPVLVYLYAVQGKKVRHFNRDPIKFWSWAAADSPIRGRQALTRISRRRPCSAIALRGGEARRERKAMLLPKTSVPPYPFEPKDVAYSLAKADAHTLSAGPEFRLAQVLGGWLGRGLPEK